MIKKRFNFSLLILSFLALSLPLATNLVQRSSDDRSRATETDKTKINFKIAFKGLKPESSCSASLKTVDLDIVNITKKVYQPGIGTSINPVAGETNSDGDQVFLVSDFVLDNNFKSTDSFNYIQVKNQAYLSARMCFNNQSSKMTTSTACDLPLTNGVTYDFTKYSLTPGDLNQDGIVNASDFSMVKYNVNPSADSQCGQQTDLNYDGITNSFDLTYLKKSLLQTNDEVVIDPTDITPTPTATPTPETTKFAVVSDTHNCSSCLENIIKKAKNDGMQIIISAGDLTRDGTKSELEAAKKVFDNSEMRYVVTPGNHDGYKGLFYNVFTKQGFQSFKINGNKFILIDNSSYGGLNYNSKTANQKNWIVSEIEECKTITCIVVMHRPINHPTSDHIMGEDNANSAAEAKWLLKLLVNNKIKEIESGHIHRFETYTKGGMKTNLVGPGLYSDFSEFTVKSDGTIIREQIKL